MCDDVYGELPRELTALLRDPRVVLPGELETLGLIENWSQGPTFSNPGGASLLPVPRYVTVGAGNQPAPSLTGATSSAAE